MIKKPVMIQIRNGLEARPVALLVQVASQYDSEIYVESEDRHAGTGFLTRVAEDHGLQRRAAALPMF